ncbi:MAG: phosphodiester glycosidase family protein [Erysipelotrichaceae bacterium]
MYKNYSPKKLEKLVREIQVKGGVEKRKKLGWYSWVLVFVDCCAVICFLLAYGPYSGFRDWLVTTALSTGSHKYFAYVLYSKDMVNKVVSANTTTQGEKFSNVDDIEFIDPSTITVYANEYEKQILQKEEGNDLYKIFAIDEGSFNGFITVVYQPQRLDLAISTNRYGNEVSALAQQNGAVVAINGGGYSIAEDYSKSPYSILISDHSIYYDTNRTGEIVGMNDEGVLMLMNSTAQEAVDAGMKWGLEFGPFLIVNGKAAEFTGNGGYGYQPRTVIGQRKDGIVILLTIDGRGGNGSNGASMVELTEVLLRYGVYNACNLDGGGSTVLVENGKVLNYPVSYQFAGERNVLDAIILK